MQNNFENHLSTFALVDNLLRTMKKSLFDINKGIRGKKSRSKKAGQFPISFRVERERRRNLLH